MAFLSKDKVKEIIQNAPPGTSPEGIVATLRNQGHTLEGFDEAAKTAETKLEEKPSEKRNAIQKIGGFLGVEELGKGISGVLFGGTKEARDLEQAGEREGSLQERVLQKIREQREQGLDTSRLTGALQKGRAGREAGAETEEELRTGGVTARQVLGSAAQTALTIGSVGAFGGAARAGRLGAAGAKALGTQGRFATRVATGAALGGGFGVAGAARGEGDITVKDIATSAAFGAAIPLGGSVLRGLGGQISDKIPQRLIRIALKQSPKQIRGGKDIAPFVLQKRKIGTAGKLLSDSQKNISRLGGNIKKIIRASTEKGVTVKKSDVINSVVSAENQAGGAITFKEVSEILNSLAPQVKGLLKGRKLTLDNALLVRQSIDKNSLGNRAFLATTVPQRVEILKSFNNILRDTIKRKAPATIPLFAEETKEITLREILLDKAAREGGRNLITFGDLFGAVPGSVIGGLPGLAIGIGARRVLASTSFLTGLGFTLSQAKRLAPVINKLDPETRALVLESIAQRQRQ